MNKLPVFEWYLKAGEVLLTVDPRVEGVDLPPNLRDQENYVNLIVGRIPTPKLTADEWGVLAPMRFSESAYTCRLPWEAVLQMSSHDAVIQFRSKDGKEGVASAYAKNRAKKGKKNFRPHLRVVK